MCPIKLPSLKAFVSAISSTKIPEEALNHPTTSTGEESYNRRNGGSKVKKNDTWELVTLPRGKRTVGCWWVYTLKHKADGSIERARLVAKGFTQTYGIDYLETCGQTKLNSVRLILSVAAKRSWPLHCISWMSKTPFFMETSTNRFI